MQPITKIAKMNRFTVLESQNRLSTRRILLHSSRSVHEELEVDPSDPGIAGVVAHVPRPQLAIYSDQDTGGQVVELDPYHRAASWRKVEGTLMHFIPLIQSYLL